MSKNKICVVVAAGSGVGLQTARLFAQNGFIVVCIRRKPSAETPEDTGL